MNITCISASNTKLMGERSASNQVCKIIRSIVKDRCPDETSINIVSLMDYEIKPCILCGKCSTDSSCPYDVDFNAIYKRLVEADGYFFVIPHYSPIPSKLLILFEKINEIAYAGWQKDSTYQPPFNRKPTAVIGHGGMAENEKVLRYYHDCLVSPVANTLRSLSFGIVPQDNQFSNGAVFGLENDSCIVKVDESIFPDIIHDWQAIEKRINPLVNNFLARLLEAPLKSGLDSTVRGIVDENLSYRR